MRKAPSDAERKLWYELRDRRLDGLKFRRQFPIGNYIADFASEACKLIVEVDGKQHDDDDAVAYDEERTKALEALGWRVIRFYAGDVVRNVKDVCSCILAAVKPSP
ncbi:MAG: uncharacterized protein JWM57_3995 [Phycisphaerales bacterium]|nr:uncharacterized protein [Phycisphaerales bacterium]